MINGYDLFEISLVHIIAGLLGNILLTFDIYPSEIESMFHAYGQIFKRSVSDKDKGNFVFGCSKGWNTGIHRISIALDMMHVESPHILIILEQIKHGMLMISVELVLIIPYLVQV